MVVGLCSASFVERRAPAARGDERVGGPWGGSRCGVGAAGRPVRASAGGNRSSFAGVRPDGRALFDALCIPHQVKDVPKNGRARERDRACFRKKKTSGTAVGAKFVLGT